MFLSQSSQLFHASRLQGQSALPSGFTTANSIMLLTSDNCISMQSLGLVFVAVYQNALKLMYVDKLLQRVKDLFAVHYSPKKYSYPEFEGHFKRELELAEQASETRLKPRQQVQGNLTNRKVDLRAQFIVTWAPHSRRCNVHLQFSGCHQRLNQSAEHRRRWVQGTLFVK